MQDDTEEGTVDMQAAVVVNETQLAEPIQEETDAGARGADHFGELSVGLAYKANSFL